MIEKLVDDFQVYFSTLILFLLKGTTFAVFQSFGMIPGLVGL